MQLWDAEKLRAIGALKYVKKRQKVVLIWAELKSDRKQEWTIV